MDNCCDALVKYLIFILNFFLFFTGVTLLVVGLFVHLDTKDYLDFMGEGHPDMSIVFIALGVLILVLGFFGCCGACTESHCMIYTFASLLTIVILVEVGIAAMVLVFRGETEELISTNMREGMNNFDPSSNSTHKGVTDTWNQVQTDFECCGVHNYTDWAKTNFSEDGKNLPDSCCMLQTDGCGKGKLESEADLTTINRDGCFKKLENEIEENAVTVGGVALGIALLQVIGVLVSCMLGTNMRRRFSFGAQSVRT